MKPMASMDGHLIKGNVRMSNVQQMKEYFADHFMKPQCYLGVQIIDELMHSGLDAEDDSYYCRLSADGFLDCTEWHGPFDSVEDCADFLLDAFAHDLEG